MVQAKIAERAKLTVGGSEFEDWTSVWVQRAWGQPFDQFKFSCAERDGASSGQVAQASQQFKPGDDCSITLAGQRALKGIILTRQTAYDANSHAVQLQGTNQTWAPATSGIEHKTNSFDNKTFDEIAEELLQKAKAKKKWKGSPPSHVFEYCHTEAGDTIFDFLKRLATNVNVVVTCNKDGEFEFIGDGAPQDNQGQLIEGVNILKMQCVISQQNARSKYIVRSQSNGNNHLRWQKAAEQEVERQGNADTFYRVAIIPMEQPPGKDEKALENCAKANHMWDAGTEVSATIVVQGWQPGGGLGGSNALWEPGADVTVSSPMAMLNQQMRIQSVTYTQDNTSGSLTTLVCVNNLKRDKFR